MAAIIMNSVDVHSTSYILNFKGKNYNVVVNHKLDENNKPVMQITPNTKEFKNWQSIRKVIWQHHKNYSCN